MNRVVLSGSLLVVLASAVAAQRSDRIVWTDGSVTDKVRVTDFTWREVKWNSRSGDEQRSADAVARLEVQAVKEAYKRAYNASSLEEKYNQFRIKADELLAAKKLFLAQFGYFEMARLQIEKGEPAEGLAVLDQLLAANCPDGGYMPEVYRLKMGFYLGQGEKGARSAGIVAKKYNETAVTSAWPQGFVRESEYFLIMAEAATGKADIKKLTAELRSLLRSTEGSLPGVANRARLALADALAQQNDPEATEIYTKLATAKGIDEATRGGALLGVGMIKFNTGNPSETEPYRDALIAFLRVYLETPNAASDTRAQALYYAAQACEKWRGEDHQLMARRLRGFLRRDFAESKWAKRN